MSWTVEISHESLLSSVALCLRFLLQVQANDGTADKKELKQIIATCQECLSPVLKTATQLVVDQQNHYNASDSEERGTRSHPGRKKLPVLPSLVLTTIFEFCDARPSSPLVRQKTLATCVLVNRTWNEFADPLLWRHPYLPTSKHIRSFLLGAWSRRWVDGLAPSEVNDPGHIRDDEDFHFTHRTMGIHLGNDAFTMAMAPNLSLVDGILDLIPRVRTLRLDFAGFGCQISALMLAAICERCPQIECLALSGFVDMDAPATINWIQAGFDRLKELKLHNFGLSDGSDLGISFSIGKRLEKLIVIGSTVSLNTLMGIVIRSGSTLRVLHIQDRELSDEFLERTSTFCGSLKSLGLFNCLNNLTSADPLSRFVRNAPELSEIWLDVHLPLDGLLNTLILHQHRIQFLHAALWKLESIQPLLEWLGICGRWLRGLGLKQIAKMDDAVMGQVVSYCPNLMWFEVVGGGIISSKAVVRAWESYRPCVSLDFSKSTITGRPPYCELTEKFEDSPDDWQRLLKRGKIRMAEARHPGLLETEAGLKYSWQHM
ncbi:hypothetical protein HK102_010387 [Quaeritorhiza haematococci]|nr:hypothetical protein HK102_010387 [Quaeritorhiza haematococci]